MIELLFASTVLFIGDSHSVGPFGWYMDENLRKAGNNVATYASCGSIARWWSTGQKTTCGYYSKDLYGRVTKANEYPTPKFQSLLNEVRPDSVIVEMGGNYTHYPNDEFIKNDLIDMVKQIKESGAKCFWVTPPHRRLYIDDLPRLYRLIQEAVGNDCKVFESTSVTNYPETGGDGIHYWFPAGLPIARKWADGVMKAYQD